MFIEIGAAIIKNSNNEILICRRPKGSHLELLWEFAGGKKEENESIEECIIRECIEELDIQVEIIEKFDEVTHTYENKNLKLHFYICRIVKGEVKRKEHAEIAWVKKEYLKNYDFCPADYDIIQKLSKI